MVDSPASDVSFREGSITPLKTTMEPEISAPLEKEKHLQTTNFQVSC